MKKIINVCCNLKRRLYLGKKKTKKSYIKGPREYIQYSFNTQRQGYFLHMRVLSTCLHNHAIDMCDLSAIISSQYHTQSIFFVMHYFFSTLNLLEVPTY